MSQTGLHQFLHGAGYGDAITNQAFLIRHWLREMGFGSEIFAYHIDPKISSEVHSLSRYRKKRGELFALYHHSIGSDLPYLLDGKHHRLITYYHNVTPPEFFERSDPMMAFNLRLGRRQLAELVPITDLTMADSIFNASDMNAAGFSHVKILPIALRSDIFNTEINADLAARLDCTRPNVLFIGRLVANKAQADLVSLFHHMRRINPEGHLYLVGAGVETSYGVWLQQLIRELGLEHHITLAGKVSQEDLTTYLKGADLYISMSEHEGFGVPLIESMYANVPVMAYEATAVRETMGDAGILFNEKDFEQLADLAWLVLENEPLRARIIEAQSHRVQRFLESNVRLKFESYLHDLKLEKPRKRIGVVIQRYGEEVNGGAEVHSRLLAEHLQEMGEIHVITTCALDHNTWVNVYPPGETMLNGVHVHRFTVDAQRVPDFAEITESILNNDRSVFDEIEWVKKQGPTSSDLLDFLRDSIHYFDLFIFYTYLYAPTYFGMPLVSDKAVFVPTAHDEPYIYFSVFRPLFHLPQYLIYNTEPEKLFVNRIMENQHVPNMIVGVGLDSPSDVSATRFRDKYQIQDPFILYVGRVDQGKNVAELISFFSRFRAETGRSLKLVLLGRVNFEITESPDVLALGFVTETDKFDALKAAEVLVMPSQFESLSIVLLEAWSQGTPVLVNGLSEVLQYQCEVSKGGLSYTSYQEFSAGLLKVIDDVAFRDRLGRLGQQFVARQYSWDSVVAKYRKMVDSVTRRRYRQ